MEINEKKTKYMVTSTHKHRRNVGELQIGNKTFERVQFPVPGKYYQQH
jgi:hypothetical protein